MARSVSPLSLSHCLTHIVILSHSTVIDLMDVMKEEEMVKVEVDETEECLLRGYQVCVRCVVVSYYTLCLPETDW